MIDFEPIRIEHKTLFAEAYVAEPTMSSGDSFGCVYLWDLLCRRNVAWLDGRLGVEYRCPRGVFYAYPAGPGDLRKAVEALEQRAASLGAPLQLRGLVPAQKERLMSEFPGLFEYTQDRDNYDYIHDIESVATLYGKKLHGKRNFCNRFEKTHDWAFLPIVPDRFDDCLMLLDEWGQENDGGNREENLAIRRALLEWDELGMLGGVLYADGKPAGFTIGERITPDTVDVHFEKARGDIPGAYPMVAREFAGMIRAALPGVRFLNREEDMGLENLRKAKEEWRPLYLLEKTAALRRDPA